MMSKTYEGARRKDKDNTQDEKGPFMPSIFGVAPELGFIRRNSNTDSRNQYQVVCGICSHATSCELDG